MRNHFKNYLARCDTYYRTVFAIDENRHLTSLLADSWDEALVDIAVELIATGSGYRRLVWDEADFGSVLDLLDAVSNLLDDFRREAERL